MVYRDDKKIDSPEESREEDSDGSGLIDKSLVPEGAKVGDKVVFKITHAFDGEYEIKYAHSDESEPEDESQKEAPEAGMEELTADA